MKKTQNSSPTVFAALLRFVYLIALLCIFYAVYDRLLKRLFDGGGIIVSLLAIWLVSAYLFLPRIHRWFSKIYVPNYYIGRVRTYDGLLGDPVNLAINGSKKDLIHAMQKAGWTQAEDLSFKSSLKMVRSSIFKNSYPQAPVSSLYLFTNKQDLAFQIEVDNNPHKRHHVRFWKTPKGWWLPGAYRTDWLGAATYDRRVGFSTLTWQITHKIAENVDEERDFVLQTLANAGQAKKITVIDNFTTGYHDKNGGGDRIRTDGALPFVDL